MIGRIVDNNNVTVVAIDRDRQTSNIDCIIIIGRELRYPSCRIKRHCGIALKGAFRKPCLHIINLKIQARFQHNIIAGIILNRLDRMDIHGIAGGDLHLAIFGHNALHRQAISLVDDDASCHERHRINRSNQRIEKNPIVCLSHKVSSNKD